MNFRNGEASSLPVFLVTLAKRECNDARSVSGTIPGAKLSGIKHSLSANIRKREAKPHYPVSESRAGLSP